MLAGVLLIVVVMLTVVASFSDWRSLRIPNWISLLIAGLYAVAHVVCPDSFSGWWTHLGAGIFMLALTFIMFAGGLFGGGDAKLASALALWLGLKGIVPFVFFMGVAGGVLALFALYIKRKKADIETAPQSWIAQVRSGRNALPYGIAISFGFAVAIFHTPSTLQQIHELSSLIH